MKRAKWSMAACEFRIHVDGGWMGDSLTVTGWASEHFGVHRDNEDRCGTLEDRRACGSWVLTHLRTGLRVGFFRSRNLAMAAARTLEEGADWRFGSWGKIDKRSVRLRKCGLLTRTLYPNSRPNWKAASEAAAAGAHP